MSHEKRGMEHSVEHGIVKEHSSVWDRWEEQLNKQRLLEEGAVTGGMIRFRKRLEEAQEIGEGGTVGATRKLLGAALGKVEAAIEADLTTYLGQWDPEKGERTGASVRGRRPIFVGWAKEAEDAMNKVLREKAEEEGKAFKPKPIDTAVVSFITLRTVLDGIHTAVPLTTVSMQIATRIIDEFTYRKFQVVAPSLFKYRLDSFTTRHYGHCTKSLDATMRWVGVDASEFKTSRERMDKMGIYLLDIIIRETGLVRTSMTTEYQFSKGKVKKKDLWQVEATPETLSWLARRNSALEILRPLHLPMVVPPLPWKKGQKGGYLFSHRVRDSYSFIKRKPWEDTPEEQLAEPMPLVYEAINRLQETPYRINRRILDLMEECVSKGGGRAGIPSAVPIEPPAKFFDTEKPKEELEEDPKFQEWMKLAHQAHRAEARRVGLFRVFDLTLEAAQAVADEPAFWYPWTVDFRGRAYPVCDALSPQGDDFQKALLLFAEAKPLGPNGAWHLAKHGANCLDEIPPQFRGVMVDGVEIRKVGRMTVQERVEWIEEHTLEIVKVAEDPWTHDWWMDADSPWCFLAFCFEWAGYWKAYQQGKGEEYLSSLPVASDGTCNGLQHYAAMLQDVVCARQVNVTANERPQDIYMTVYEAALEQIQKDAEEGNAFALLWLESGLLGRSLFKRPTMTFGYGSWRYGFAEQIQQYVEDAIGKREAIQFFDGDGTSLVKACIYLSEIVCNSLGAGVGAAIRGRDWLQACARAIAGEGKNVTWEVPLTGFRVVQTYSVLEKKQIKTVLLGSVVQPTLYVSTGKPDPRKQATAIAPNVVHSLDAAAMMLTVVNCSREHEDRFSFQMVHDSFATHAGDAETLNRVLRESFVQLYTQVDVLGWLYEQFKAQVEDPSALPEPPSKGALDVSEVLVSDHFFC